MTYQEYILNRIYLIDLLLDYIYHSKSNEDKEIVLLEIMILRKEVRYLEDLTKTEKQREVKFITMTIESNF